MTSRRVVFVSIITGLVLVQLAVFYSWVRPRLIHYYISPNVHVPRHLDSSNSARYNLPRQLQTSLASVDIASSTVHAAHSVGDVGHAVPQVLNSTSLNHLFHSSGTSWKPNTFCDDFLGRRYHTPVKVCEGETQESAQIKCFWNPVNAHAATCDVENVVVRPPRLWTAMEDVMRTFPHSGSLWLLENNSTSCTKPAIHHLARTMEGGDYVKWFVDDLISNPTKQVSTCQRWINETVFLFSSHSHHIYFRFLAYYAVHKSLLDHRVEPGRYRIFRLSEGYNYLFPDYEKALFPGIQPLTDLPDSSICFKKAVVVPKCYATVLFQCKMQAEIRSKCLGCNGSGLPGTSLISFRSRVLAACGLQDAKSTSDQSLISVILRKPYTRWKGDHPHQFERILTNSDQLIAGLHKAFPNSIIKALHMEDMAVCEQVSYTHAADVLIGVHGAGLVHLWWLRKDAVIIELEPYFEMGNPSFRTLAKLTGRRYVGIAIRGSSGGVSVDVDDVVKQVKSHSSIT